MRVPFFAFGTSFFCVGAIGERGGTLQVTQLLFINVHVQDDTATDRIRTQCLPNHSTCMHTQTHSHSQTVCTIRSHQGQCKVE